LAQIVSAALSRPYPKAADRYEDTDVKKLIAVCCELQRLHGKRPFFLSCRDAARFIGGSATQRTKWNQKMNELCTDGVLQCHQKGTRGRATEYFFLGNVT
jgi:hypothetical protein